MFFEHEHLSLDLFTYRVPYEPFLHTLTVFVKESVLNVRADLKVKKKTLLYFTGTLGSLVANIAMLSMMC